MWWMLLLIVWGMINLIAGIIILTDTVVYGSAWELFFPVQGYLIDRTVDYNLTGKIIIIGLGSVFFLPLTTLVLIVFGIIALFLAIVKLFNLLFKKD